MQENDILAKVAGILSKYAKNEDARDSINMETSILEDLKINSARLVDIVLEFEDDFGIEVEDEDADKIVTVGDAVTLIAAQGKTLS